MVALTKSGRTSQHSQRPLVAILKGKSSTLRCGRGWLLDVRQNMSATTRTIASIVGPWTDPGIETGLMRRCREAWGKPLDSLSNEELATFLRQKIAIAHLLPIARKRVADHFEDGTELYDEELANAISHAEKPA